MAQQGQWQRVNREHARGLVDAGDDWDIPILKGEYIPANGGTLGGLGLTFTETTPHVFGVSTFYYDVAGNPVTDATGGIVEYVDDVTTQTTGIVARVNMSFYRMRNGPCRGCADHPRDQVQTSDVGKFEWTGPRSGRYTVNGQSQDMVEAMSGPPLVAATDFSGVWMVVRRFVSGEPPDYAMSGDGIVRGGVVQVIPVTEARSYRIENVALGQPPAGVPLPPANSRRYDVRCIGPTYFGTDPAHPGPRCAFDELSPNANEMTLWFDDLNLGRALNVVRDQMNNNERVIRNNGTEKPRLYATSDRIVWRQKLPSPYDRGIGVSEWVMVRLDTLPQP